jgi:organic hydroperoxide reductase OsmC/OhrA
MTAIPVKIEWARRDELFTDNRYSRVHRWTFDGGAEVVASSSPQIVPLPMSDAAAIDPEEAFVAALSSCHMLWFLSLAAKKGLRVNRYVDLAEGRMDRNEAGKLVMLEVCLRPKVEWDGEQPDTATVAAIHHSAHDECFIANSVRTKVTIEPR